MKKKQKNVQPATEQTPKESVKVEEPEQLITEEKEAAKDAAEKKPELTLEQRFDKFEKETEEAFHKVGDYLQKLGPLIQLSEQVEARQKQTAEAGQNPSAPTGQGGAAGIIMQLLNSPLAPMLLGGGSNPMQEKLNALSEKLLTSALERSLKPSQFEQFFEEEIAKAKAKAMARSVLKE